MRRSRRVGLRTDDLRDERKEEGRDGDGSLSRPSRIESAAWAVLAAVFVLRIAALLLIGDPGSDAWEGRISYTDTHSYLHAAEDLADGSQDEPLFRTPGYPLLLNATSDPRRAS